MASSSSATRDWKFDVFICFHGEDTRKEFTSHLHKALEDKSYIMTFIDEKLEKTKSIDELLTILEKSAISVVIFSPNFAKSTWCLDEVATIAQSMDNFGHRVLPVFYKVEPSDVSGDPCCIYATDIDGLPESEKKKEEWKNALKLVCNRSGRTLAETKKDSELVELIVGNVQKIVEDLYPRVKDKEWVDMDLRVLQWDNYPLVSLPSGFSPQNLRILCLRNNSIVKCWEGECQMVKLVELDLSGCIYLTAVPDLSKSTRLEVLILRYCRSLVELPSYVGNLENLVRLDVKDCLQLHNIPTQLNSKVLKYVLMSKCENLTCCPEISNSTKLEVLDLENTPIYEPPPASTYNRVQNGGTLRLNCEKITSFPTLSSTLSELSLCNTSIREIDFSPPHSPGFESLTQPRFQQLELNYNLVLKSLPDNIWEMVSTDIFVRNCPLLETLPNISGSVQNGLTRLIVTDCKCLKRVPSSISNLKHLQVLFLINLPITALPSSVGELSQLSTLDLFGCTSLESIPDTIYNLSKLHVLTVGGCRKLVYLPRLPPSLLYLTAARCKLLRDLPSNLQELSCKEIWLDRCSQVDRGSIAIMVTNVLDQSMALHAKGNLVYPDSKLPERLCYQTEEGTSVEVKLPSASARQHLKGFLFGAVTLRRRSDTQVLGCRCQIELADGSRAVLGIWRSTILVSVDDTCRYHVHMWFTNQSGRGLMKQIEAGDIVKEEDEEEEEEEEVWYVKYAGLTVSFIFYDDDDDKFMDIKRCGVTLLY
ncbi:Disease resistance protein TAO1 [Linum perenne]